MEPRLTKAAATPQSCPAAAQAHSAAATLQCRYGSDRCTSPASSATRARRRRRSTSSRPPSSTPAATPCAVLPAQLAAEQRVALAVGREDRRRLLREAPLERAQQRGERRLDVGRLEAEPGRARRAASGGRSSHADRDVDADAEHHPALLRAALGEDAGDLAAAEQDVVGPLDRGACAPTTSATATARGERQQRAARRAARAT